MSPSQVAELNNALLLSNQTGNVFFLTSFFSVVPVVLPCVLVGPPWPPSPLTFASITADEPDSHNYTPLTLIMRSLSWRLARHLFWCTRSSSQLSGQSGGAGADPPLGKAEGKFVWGVVSLHCSKPLPPVLFLNRLVLAQLPLAA